MAGHQGETRAQVLSQPSASEFESFENWACVCACVCLWQVCALSMCNVQTWDSLCFLELLLVMENSLYLVVLVNEYF